MREALGRAHVCGDDRTVPAENQQEALHEPDSPPIELFLPELNARNKEAIGTAQRLTGLHLDLPACALGSGANDAILLRGLTQSSQWRKDWNRTTRLSRQARAVTEQFPVLKQTTEPFLCLGASMGKASRLTPFGRNNHRKK